MMIKCPDMKWPDPPPLDNTIVFEDDNVFNILAKPIINFSVGQDEWCGYKGECKKDMTNAWDVCILCKYRKKLDIPAMMDKAYEEQDGDNL